MLLLFYKIDQWVYDGAQPWTNVLYTVPVLYKMIMETKSVEIQRPKRLYRLSFKVFQSYFF